MKITKEMLVEEIMKLNLKTAADVLMEVNKRSTKEHWKRNGVQRIAVFFAVCREKNIDCTRF